MAVGLPTNPILWLMFDMLAEHFTTISRLFVVIEKDLEFNIYIKPAFEPVSKSSLHYSL